MEKRAIVVVFDGNEPPKNIIERIVKEITTWCEANPEHTSIYTLDEKDIIATVSKSFISVDHIVKCRNGDNAIKCLNKTFPFKTFFSTGSFCVDLSIRLMNVLDREHSGLMTDTDKEIVNAVVTLGKGCIYSTRHAEELGYSKEFNKVVTDVYKRIFNEDGTFKK